MDHYDPPREQLIHRDRLHPNPDNPRTEAGNVTELARSIRENGQFMAVLVRPAPEIGEGHFYIEDGYRRWVAMNSTFSEIRCHIRFPIHGEDLRLRSIVVGLSANTGKPLDPIERAMALGRMSNEFNMTQAAIAKATGFHPTQISNSLMLLELNNDTLERVRAGKLSVTDAQAIVQRHRAKVRKSKGQKPVSVGWEPDYLTKEHPLASKAVIMCEARAHNSRRRIGRGQGFVGACGQCWETVIRQDEALVQQVKLSESVANVPFMPPWPVDHPMSSKERQ